MKKIVFLLATVILGLAVWAANVSRSGAAGYETAHAFDGKAQATPYQLETQKWRQDEEKDIHDRWLSLVALAWLKEGKNNFGSDHHNEVVLPAHAAPPQAGYFELNKGVISIHADAGADVKTKEEDKPVTAMTLKPDTAGKPDTLTMKTLTMFLHGNDGQFTVRVRDSDSESAKNFHGLKFFPVNPSYRVIADFVPYEPKKKIMVPDI